MQKEITVPGVGSVLVSKKANAKNLKLRIHPEKGVMVTMPYRATMLQAKAFILKNSDWIKEKLQYLNQKKSSTLFFSDSTFKTRNSNVRFIVDERVSLTRKIKGSELSFLYNPLRIDFLNKDVQTFIKKSILKLLLKESKYYLRERYERLSEICSIHASKLSFGSASTRWGTCNSKNEIRLSCRLMLLPDYLIDYVILHEISHIIHKNHGKDFHDLLNKLTDEKSSILNKELRKHSIHLMPGDFSF